MKTEYTVSDTAAGERLDIYLAAVQKDMSRSHIKSVIEKGLIKVDGKVVKAGYSLKGGEYISADYPDNVALKAVAEDIPIDIVYEDDSIAVINKAQGMVVHPAVGNRDGTLVNALLYNLKSLSTINGVIRPGIVHRLDKDTSGLLVVAKNDNAHRKLQAQIQKKDAKRYYLALVDGNIKDDTGIINQPIGRSRSDRKKMAVVSDGRAAETHYTVLERFGRYTLCEFELKTGRTHQIRVHARYINHPVVGDKLYGGSDAFHLNGQLLHAYKLVLTHPDSGEIMTFTAPLPYYFLSILDKLRKTA